MVAKRSRGVLSGVVSLLMATTTLAALPQTAAVADATTRPFTIPAVKEVGAGSAQWTLQPTTTVHVSGRVTESDGTTLATELAASLKLSKPLSVIREGTPAAGDIVLTTGTVPGTTSSEAYRIDPAGGIATITGASADGTWQGTRTLMQVIADKKDGRTDALTQVITDEPGVQARILAIDVGRKYFTPDFIKNQIRQMSYLKLNQLQLHLSEGTGYHLESAVAPEAVSEKFWTKADVAEILAVAKQYHIEVIPDIDTPAHMDNLLKAHPEWQLTVNGQKQPGKMDFSIPEARAFVKALIDEVADMFPDAKTFHIGGDEYLPAPWEMSGNTAITDSSAPSLVTWANETQGRSDLNVYDAYPIYMNEIGDHVRAKGMTARMWNDDVYPTGSSTRQTIQVDKRTQIDQWIRWNSSKPSAKDFADADYPIINANGDYLYYILTNSDNGDGLGKGPNKNPKAIYERWSPTKFMGAAGNGGDYDLTGHTPLGAHLSVWCDKPDAQTEADVARRLPEWVRAFAQSTYGTPKIAATQADFEVQAKTIGAVPSLELKSGGEESPDPVKSLDGPGLTATNPALQDFQPAADTAPWRFTDSARIIVPADQPSLKSDATLVAKELRVLGKTTKTLEIVVGDEKDAKPGDIVFTVNSGLDVANDQGYKMTITDRVVIEGKTADATFWGTRTLLQSIKTSNGAQAGVVLDWPASEERSFHVDAARKYYSPDFFKELIPNMAWQKANTLQYHFSENEGFRLESTAHPEILSDKYITKAELKDIIDLATQYHIKVIPALDMPGHLRQVLNAHPEFRLSSSSEGMRGLDYSKPEAVNFMKELVAEYAPLFPSNTWHLGADEFIDFARAARTYPQLKTFAEQRTGNPDATVADGFTTFVNDMVDYLGTLGKTDVRVWNDGFYRGDNKQTVELSKNATIDYWTAWDHNMAPVTTFVDAGYKIINFNDKYMYYVLPLCPTCAYSNRPKVEDIFNEFHTGVFAKPKTSHQYVWNAPYPQWLRGASFAVWSDKADFETERQVLDNTAPLFGAFADRTWKPGDTRSWSEANAAMTKVGRAPLIPVKTPVVLKFSLSADPVAGTVEPGSEITYTATVKNDTAAKVQASVKVDLSQTGKDLSADDVTATLLEANGEPAVGKSENVALASNGATVSASGVESLGKKFQPDLLIDGKTDNDSRWSSNESDQANATITFAKPAVLDKVRLAWQAACAPRYELMIKVNGEWQTVGGVQTLTCPTGRNEVKWTEQKITTTDPIEAVKIQAHERQSFSGEKFGVSLWEIEAISVAPAIVVPGVTISDGTLEWAGDLEKSQSIKLVWKGVAPKATDVDIELPVTLNASAVALDETGSAEPVTVTHSVEKLVAPDPTEKPTTDPVVLEPKVELNTTELNLGADVVVKVSGFKANPEGTDELNGVVVIHSDPVELGVIKIDATGSGTATVRIPADQPLGEHTIEVVQKGADIDMTTYPAVAIKVLISKLASDTETTPAKPSEPAATETTSTAQKPGKGSLPLTGVGAGSVALLALLMLAGGGALVYRRRHACRAVGGSTF